MGEISEALRRAKESGAAPVSRRTETPKTYRDAMLDESSGARPEPGPPVEIPLAPPEHGHGRAVLLEPKGPVAEHYRHFAIRLNRTLKQANARSVMITSAARSEGKTTTACNLALALSSIAGGRQIAFVELDIRRPSAATELGVTPRVGIEAVLAADARLPEARLTTNLPDLDLYLASQPRDDALALLSGPQLPPTLRELGRQYDLVVIDSPPVLPVPDVPLILQHADAALVVARAGISRKHAFEQTLEVLGREKLVGVFLNQSGSARQARHYGYYSPEPGSGESGSPPEGSSNKEATS
ncbi:MAG: CpsD/CapB family tyrosine-protein kinase [Deltaproteobacteria bacterium]|nr:CpsD/CapB family tyrosine-protein kinase [Deltaproteobacteria bacterium]MBW2395522.1 CpsD/CapB family tyrosine-protein kinase [Deltaproteobacteria bacterium]